MFITPIKTSITIMGTEIDIMINDQKLNDENADGLYEAETIYLRSSYSSAREYRRILGHEAFHALADVLGAQLDHNLEEILAHRVSTMFAYEL